MPSNLRYVHETHAHIVSVYRRMILNEDVATALRRKPAPVTVASLTAASLEHLDSVRNPRPVSLPTKSVVKCMEFMAQTDAADLRQHFTSERARDAAFEILSLSPSDLVKHRFNDDAHRWTWLAAALWYARRSFEWTYERATERLLSGGTAYRAHTVTAARLALRYELRDGFSALAFLPRDPAIADDITDARARFQYLEWSVDYDGRSGMPMAGADHWGRFDR